MGTQKRNPKTKQKTSKKQTPPKKKPKQTNKNKMAHHPVLFSLFFLAVLSSSALVSVAMPVDVSASPDQVDAPEEALGNEPSEEVSPTVDDDGVDEASEEEEEEEVSPTADGVDEDDETEEISPGIDDEEEEEEEEEEEDD